MPTSPIGQAAGPLTEALTEALQRHAWVGKVRCR
jgi:hypothetical protein